MLTELLVLIEVVGLVVNFVRACQRWTLLAAESKKKGGSYFCVVAS